MTNVVPNCRCDLETLYRQSTKFVRGVYECTQILPMIKGEEVETRHILLGKSENLGSWAGTRRPLSRFVSLRWMHQHHLFVTGRCGFVGGTLFMRSLTMRFVMTATLLGDCFPGNMRSTGHVCSMHNCRTCYRHYWDETAMCSKGKITTITLFCSW